jgi:hypothetical protein
MSTILKQPTPITEIDKIKITNTQCLNVIKAAAQKTYNLFWFNTTKTPQELCNELGTDAVKAFIVHAKLQELIYLLDPSWEVLVPPYEYVAHEDGSITIIIPEQQTENE